MCGRNLRSARVKGCLIDSSFAGSMVILEKKNNIYIYIFKFGLSKRTRLYNINRSPIVMIWLISLFDFLLQTKHAIVAPWCGRGCAIAILLNAINCQVFNFYYYLIVNSQIIKNMFVSETFIVTIQNGGLNKPNTTIIRIVFV